MYMWKLPVGIEWDYWGSMGSSVGGGGGEICACFWWDFSSRWRKLDGEYGIYADWAMVAFMTWDWNVQIGFTKSSPLSVLVKFEGKGKWM